MKNSLVFLYARWALLVSVVLVMAVGCARHSTDLRMFQGSQGPLTMTPDEILNLEVGRLHEHVQPEGPVGVQWVDGLIESEHARALTSQAGNGWLIQLDRRLTGFALADTIVHEWAHMLAPSANHEDHLATCGGHGPQWGVEFSRAYRAVWFDVDTPDYLAVPQEKNDGKENW